MIARTWTGHVSLRHADAFHDHLLATGVAEAAATPGFLGAQVLRAETEFRSW